jgi:spermidine synthase
MVGLGGGSIARFVHERLPEARMTVVELSAQVVAAARTFFGLPVDDARLSVVVGDGARRVPRVRGGCDVLLLDAFEDGRAVKPLATQAFYDACCAALRPGGMLVVNFIADEPRFGTYLARIERAFAGRVLCMPTEDRVNMIVFALKRPGARIAIEPLRRLARELKARHGLRFDRFLRDLVAHNAASAAYLRFNRGTSGN